MTSISLSRSSPVAAHTNGHILSRSRDTSESSQLDHDGDTVMSDAPEPQAHRRSSIDSQHEQKHRPSYSFGMDGASDLSETVEKNGSALVDSEAATPASLQSNDAHDDGSASHGSRRASKRKTSIEDDEHIANNPELYGLRRSGRARPTRRLVESSDEESDAADMVSGKSRKRRKAEPSRKTSKRATPYDETDEGSGSGSDVYRNARKRSLGKKKAPARLGSEVAHALLRAEGRSSTRRATKVTNYNEDDDDDPFSEGTDALTPNYGPIPDDRPAIDAVLNHRPQEGQSITEEDMTRDAFEYFIKWQGKAHYHATWETTTSLSAFRGFRRLENYYRKTVVQDIRMSAATDLPPEEKEKWNLDRERDVDALSDHMKVERVIGTRDGEEGTEYFVKWKGLAYDSSTWESSELVSKIAQPAIDRYLDRSSQVLKSNKVEGNPTTRSAHKPIREQPPYLKNGELRDFQVTGLNFLAYNWCKSNNVILADEMGLGKTVQTVSFMNWLRHDRGQQGPFLVVVPLSTIPAWTDTFDHWTPDLNFVVYTGNEAARKIIRDYELWDTDGGANRWKFNVLLTTYEYINLDIKELMQIKWQFMAVDEAHRLKNRESQLYAKLRDLKAPSRLLITGTPMQNTLGELTALMDFLMPGAVTIDEEINLQSQEAGQMIAELTKAIKPFILRRTKAKVENDLPPKSEKIIRVELADVQRTHYKNIITRNYTALNDGAKGPKQSLLNIVMELRKASNHPFMFENVKERILNGSDRREDLLKGLITSSGKMMLLDRLLTKLKKDGHRVLIFSQMVKMLDILSEYLQLRGYQFQRLDGTIAAGPRRIAIDHFNAPESNDFCFLLSTRAGGLGINLMTADTVILFDADWNPHADLQAMARAHRIGQKKPVSVYRFVAKDSIEEDVLLRARNKLLLEFITIQRGVTDESSKQYSDLLAKAGSNVAEPTTPDDISRILKHRSQKMFEESSTQKKLEELDIDAVLEDAEEHKIDGPAGLEADGGEEFLKSFNYMDVKLDPEWDDIIPPEQLVEIKAEAKRSADERYLNEVIQQNAPRKRKAADNERGERAQKRAREMAAAVEAREGAADDGESSDEDPSRPLTEKELRDLFRGFLRYGSLDDRTDEILREANLVGRDLNLLREALDEITALSKRLLSEERARVRAHERAHQKALTKKDRKAVLFDYKGVKRLNAETILDRPGEMSLLREVVDGCSKVEHFRVPEASKAAHYSCTWGSREDGMLLVGILRHGYGAWSAIRDDPELGMSDKLFLEEQRVAKKEERTKADGPAANKMAKSPGAVHLVRRADYLLSVLKERRSGIDSQTPERGSVSPSPARGDTGRNHHHHHHEAGPSSSATPTTTTTITTGRAGLKRKSGGNADSDLVRSKRPRTSEDGRPSVEAGLDEEAILQSLFRPVRESLGLVRSATKDGVPCKTERAKILRRELLRIGTHISTLVKGVEDGPALEGRLWDFASTYWPNPGTPGDKLRSMHERLVEAESASTSAPTK